MAAAVVSTIEIDDLRGLARDELTPLVAHGVEGRVNRELYARLGERGVLGLLFPVREDRRAQADAATICAVREALAYGCLEAEVATGMQGIGGYPVLQSGTEAHLDRWLSGLRDGSVVAAFALTEPDAGSDAANLQLTAAPDGDGWRLSGLKRWITNAPDADFYVTFARTTRGAGARGVTAFLVPADRAGLHGTSLEMVGPHPIGELVFDDVRVGADDVLGEVDRGFKVAMRTFNLFRPSVGAGAVGMAQAALDATVERVAQRHAFGRPLGTQQSVAHALADAATSLQAARLLVQDSARAHDEGDPAVASRSAMGKLFATEVAQNVIDTAVQFHGAAGLEVGHLIGKLYTEIRAARIYEGASEVQRDIIARHLFQGSGADLAVHR
jgi:alkylation response protein AidB-like acyl-CoA dehydrogenase